jgi:hypothetical protein
MDFMSMEPGERQQIIDGVFDKYGLGPVKTEKSEQAINDDPLGIR